MWHQDGARLGAHRPVVPLLAGAVTLALLWQFWASGGAHAEVTIAAVVIGYLVVLGYFAHITLAVGQRATRLEQLVETDPLTGLPNRRAWNRLLPILDADAERAGLLLGVAVLDLDHFKQVNDLRGHAGGDAVLTAVAAAWRQQLPASALVVRWGGEEFAALLRVADAEEAVATTERMRAAMPEGVTCSAGVAVVGHDETASAAFERADAALYRAKDAGRDRLVVADEERDDESDTRRGKWLRHPLTVALGTVALAGVVALSGMLLQTILFVGALGLAAAGVVVARRRGTSILFSSRALLGGFVLVIVGQIAEGAGLGATGRASPVDALFLAGYTTIALATIGLGRRAQGRQVGSGLDAAVVAAGLTTAVLVILSQHMPIAWYSVQGLTYAIWPLVDVVMLSVFVWLGLSPEIREVDARLLPVALGALLATDTAVAVLEPAGRYQDGDPLDAGWFLAVAILAIAAWAASRRQWRVTGSDVLPSWRALALATGTLAPVVTLGLIDLQNLELDFGAMLAGTALLALLGVRIWTLLRLATGQSTELAEASRRDPLTGLPNRRGWTEHATREFSLAGRHGRTLALVMIDVDHFSEVNARLGHVGGDRVLAQASTSWRESLRTNDVLGRWGGEEFAVLMPDCDADYATSIIDRLRGSTPADARFSAGVAETRGGEAVDAVLARADEALYAAKHAGRDRTLVAPPSDASDRG